MNEKKIYEAPAIEELEINGFIVVEGLSPKEKLDELGGYEGDLGPLSDL